MSLPFSTSRLSRKYYLSILPFTTDLHIYSISSEQLRCSITSCQTWHQPHTTFRNDNKFVELIEITIYFFFAICGVLGRASVSNYFFRGTHKSATRSLCDESFDCFTTVQVSTVCSLTRFSRTTTRNDARQFAP